MPSNSLPVGFDNAHMISVTALYVAVTLAAGGGAPDPLPWDFHSWRRYEDPKAQLAFPVPLTQTLVESRHFTGTSPGQMTDVITLSGPQGFELEIGVFRDAGALELEDWIASYAAFLKTADTTRLLWHATRAHLRAQLFEQPRDGQTWARRTAVFRAGNRIIKLSCLNKDDPRSEAEFETILEQLEVLE